jgi:hypothetical protein
MARSGTPTDAAAGERPVLLDVRMVLHSGIDRVRSLTRKFGGQALVLRRREGRIRKYQRTRHG